jgi:hypothetical protein
LLRPDWALFFFVHEREKMVFTLQYRRRSGTYDKRVQTLDDAVVAAYLIVDEGLGEPVSVLGPDGSVALDAVGLARAIKGAR